MNLGTLLTYGLPLVSLEEWCDKKYSRRASHIGEVTIKVSKGGSEEILKKAFYAVAIVDGRDLEGSELVSFKDGTIITDHSVSFDVGKILGYRVIGKVY